MKRNDNCVICGLTSEFINGLNSKQECENCEALFDIVDEDEVDLSIVEDGYDWINRYRRSRQEV